MAAALYRGNAREAPPQSGADGGFIVERVGQAETRPDASVPSRHEAAGILATGAEAGEPQRSGTAISARIRPRGIEVRVLVFRVYRRQGEVIAQSDIDGQLAADAPVVLRVEPEIGILLRHVTNGLRPSQDGVSNQ